MSEYRNGHFGTGLPGVDTDPVKQQQDVELAAEIIAAATAYRDVAMYSGDDAVEWWLRGCDAHDRLAKAVLDWLHGEPLATDLGQRARAMLRKV